MIHVSQVIQFELQGDIEEAKNLKNTIALWKMVNENSEGCEAALMCMLTREASNRGSFGIQFKIANMYDVFMNYIAKKNSEVGKQNKGKADENDR